MTGSVSLKIDSCRVCPNMKSQRFYTEDSFEHVMEWMCGAHYNTRITLHETFDETPPIPKWCPLRKEKE